MKNIREYVFLSIGVFFLSISLFLSYSSSAQDKVFTIDEAVLGGGGRLVPKNMDQLQWVTGSSFYSHVSGDSLKVWDAAKRKLVLTVLKSDLVNSLLLSGDGLDTLRKMPRVTWTNPNYLKYTHVGRIYGYDIPRKRTTYIANYNAVEMENAEINYTQNTVAYTVGSNVFNDGIQLTFDTLPGIVNGVAAHRSEFGITKGLFWSNTGTQLAFYHMNESMVAEYPIYDLKKMPANHRNIRYPIAGTPSHLVTIGVYNVKTAKTTYLKTGEPQEQYLTNITWSPDDKFIYVAVVNRAQNHMWLRQYDVETGNYIKTLFEETNDKYVEPEHGLTFLKSDPTKFIWWSERDGYNHLYLYDINGNLISQLTKGNWVVTELNGVDKKGENLFITATAQSPTERHLYSINIKTLAMKQLTKGTGTHTVTLSPEGNFFIDHYQSLNTPREIRIISANGEKETLLHSALNPLTGYKTGEITLGSLKTANGTDIYYRLIKPINFDPGKKYPVVVYLYNGPHVQLVNNTWLGGSNFWMHYMAQHGYIVYTIDGRGSLNRGMAFESAIFRNVGTVEMEDQLNGIDYLKSLPYVDGSRIGIHGWSYGGFMTTSLMTRSPDVFKVGVAGGPVIDWKLYEIMYTERYMDSPSENPVGFEGANLLNYTKNLKGKLLMIHGGEDDVVLWQHSLLYLEKCIKEGVQLDYFVYPHHPHNVSGKDRVHLMDKVSRYFFDNL